MARVQHKQRASETAASAAQSSCPSKWRVERPGEAHARLACSHGAGVVTREVAQRRWRAVLGCRTASAAYTACFTLLSLVRSLAV